MSEHILSIKLRIHIIERLSEIDLPWFMFEQLDQLLSEINYFKLMNLKENMESFSTFLTDVNSWYQDTLTHLQSEKIPTYSYHMYESYLTDRLYAQKRKPTCGLKELLKLKQRCLVIVLLSIKEYMYKRPSKQLLQRSRLLQNDSSLFSSFVSDLSEGSSTL